jgi:hypothetical protein
MQKAQHDALIQNTNMALLGIRATQIQYYVNVYSAIGLQSAFISGYAFSASTQVAFFTNTLSTYYYSVCQDMFWVASAICMAACLHCLATTVFLQVLGPGAALHGSMEALSIFNS